MLQNARVQVYSQRLQSATLVMACLYGASALFFLLTWPRLGTDVVSSS